MPENLEAIDDSLIIPSYMKNKLSAHGDPNASKFDKALSQKAELQVKARPLHLQHDLNAELTQKGFVSQASNSGGNNFNSSTITTTTSPSVTQTSSLDTLSAPPSLPPPTSQPTTSPFFSASSDSNPFLASANSSNDNPFLPPPSSNPTQGAPINPFF
jgi:hypothetical protein